VLLLYNNRISQIDRSAFQGLHSLQKLYLSQNMISRFPLELVKDKTRLEKLSLMDISSNRIKVHTSILNNNVKCKWVFL
jgi:Leucine-rich repeat (LRR) protein